MHNGTQSGLLGFEVIPEASHRRSARLEIALQRDKVVGAFLKGSSSISKVVREALEQALQALWPDLHDCRRFTRPGVRAPGETIDRGCEVAADSDEGVVLDQTVVVPHQHASIVGKMPRVVVPVGGPAPHRS